MFPNELIQKFRKAFFGGGDSYALTTIDVFNSKIENKEVYDFQKLFIGVPAAGKSYVSMRTPTTANAHLVVSVFSEGKAYFKSYTGTTWTDDGTSGTIFNRYIDGADPSVLELYYGGTPNVLGTQRFEVLMPGGSGPFASGASIRSDSESILANNMELTIEVENVTNANQDISIAVEWFEERV